MKILNSVVLLLSIVSVVACNRPPETGQSLEAMTFSIVSAGSDQNRQLNSQTPAAQYQLDKILLQTDQGGSAGKTTLDFSKARFATLVLSCTERMVSSACGDYAATSLKIQAQKTGEPQYSELLSLSGSVKRFVTPTSEEELAQHKQRALNAPGSAATPLDKGRLLVTVPINTLVDSANPKSVKITVSSGNGKQVAFDANLTAASTTASAGCNKKSDCPAGQVCHYTHQCRDGECQDDSECREAIAERTNALDANRNPTAPQASTAIQRATSMNAGRVAAMPTATMTAAATKDAILQRTRANPPSAIILISIAVTRTAMPTRNAHPEEHANPRTHALETTIAPRRTAASRVRAKPVDAMTTRTAETRSTVTHPITLASQAAGLTVSAHIAISVGPANSASR